MPSRKPTSAAAPKPDGEKPTLANRLIDRVLDRMDLDELTSTLADKLCEKLMVSLNVDRLATTLFDMHGEELEQGLIDAIVHRL